MNGYRRDPLIPALLLAIALVCVIAFFLSFKRDRGVVVEAPREPGTASITFLDVGQGDATLIRSPEGKLALVDAGPSKKVVELLRARGVESLDLVVVSHHHSDHYGGMLEVVRAFHPRLFLDVDSPHLTPNYLALLRTVQELKIPMIHTGPRTRTIGLGSVRLIVYRQGPLDKKEENNNSVGIRVEYGSFSALLTGDSEVRERRWWMDQMPELCERVQLLKLAHHGSRNGTDARWLALTNPSHCIASLGINNEFGHPHAETLALLKARSIPLSRTDQDGSILIETDGQTWNLQTEHAKRASLDTSRGQK